AFILPQHRIAVFRLAVEITRDASSAVAILAIGFDLEAVVAQYGDDRTVARDVEDLAALLDLNLKRRIDGLGSVVGRGEILVMHVEGPPSRDAGLGRMHEAWRAAEIDVRSDLEGRKRASDIEASRRVAVVVMKLDLAGRDQRSQALVEGRARGTARAIMHVPGARPPLELGDHRQHRRDADAARQPPGEGRLPP